MWSSSIFLEFEDGGFVFQHLGNCLWEVHTLFLPKAKSPLWKARQAALHMFCATNCAEIITKVPAFNIPARRLTEQMWFVHDFTRPGAWGEHAIDYFRLPIKGWMFKEKKLAEAGHEFHERLPEISHAEDVAHDQVVGYALKTASSGLLLKALQFYNEWAIFAGYVPAILINENTAVIGDVTVAFSGGGYEICQ